MTLLVLWALPVIWTWADLDPSLPPLRAFLELFIAISVVPLVAVCWDLWERNGQ